MFGAFPVARKFDLPQYYSPFLSPTRGKPALKFQAPHRLYICISS